MGNQSFVLEQINTRHNQREKGIETENRREEPHSLILAVMDSKSKSTGMVLCKLRRHSSLIGRCECTCVTALSSSRRQR